MGTRTSCQANGIGHHILGSRHLAHQGLQGKDILGLKDGLRFLAIKPSRLAYHLDLIFHRKILDHRIKEEAVQLRFGQGIGALELDRVLGRED